VLNAANVLNLINQEFTMAKGNNSKRKEIKKPKKDKSKPAPRFPDEVPDGHCAPRFIAREIAHDFASELFAMIAASTN